MTIYRLTVKSHLLMWTSLRCPVIKYVVRRSGDGEGKQREGVEIVRRIERHQGHKNLRVSLNINMSPCHQEFEVGIVVVDPLKNFVSNDLI